jgi:hypothetical protein
MMSSYVDFPLASKCWRCNACRNVPFDNQEEAGRLLSIWPLVRCGSGCTPMRSTAVEVAVHPPPRFWQWGASEAEVQAAMMETKVPEPAPVRRKNRRGHVEWVFSREDSDMIWRGAQRFASAAPPPGLANVSCPA